MPRVSRWSGRLGRRMGEGRDRGAVAALVAMLLSSGVLLGMTAFSLDLGTMYGERAQLISGANSAAMTIAQDCVRPGRICHAAPGVGVAKANANGNAVDNRMAVDGVCGHDRFTGQLAPCSATGGPGTRCLSTPRPGVNYAEAYTSTLTPDGKMVLPPAVAGTFMPDGYQGAHIMACSRVVWGTPGGPYSAFAVASCRFNALARPFGVLSSTMPTAYPAIPPAPAETAIRLSAPAVGNGCASGGPAGGTNRGLVRLNAGGGAGPCQLGSIAADADLSGHTENSSTASGTGVSLTGCTALLNSRMSRPALDNNPRPYLMIPIYSGVTSVNPVNGAANFDDIIGIAAFQVTGYKLDGSVNGVPAGGLDLAFESVPSATSYCGPGTTVRVQCIRGYFVSVNIIDGTWPQPGWDQNLALNAFRTDG